jgi:hypothetical protein
MTRDPRTVALAYVEAVGSKSLDALDSIIHPDVEFTGPTRSLRGIAAFKEALRRFLPIVKRTDVRRTFVDGDEVCVIYDLVTDTAVGAVPAMEWVAVEDGLIRRITLIFHSAPWPQVLEEASRRMTRPEPASLRA